MKYLPIITERVERALSAILPSMFALVFDEWTRGKTHYLGMFASFPTSSALGYGVPLFKFFLMGDESSLDAAEHVSFMKYIIGVYGKHL